MREHRTGNTAWLLAIACGLGLGLGGAGAAQAGHDHGRRKACSATAWAQRAACDAELAADVHTARAICLNISDRDERAACYRESLQAKREGRRTCKEQRVARLDLCDELGEERYDPPFEPSEFQTDFASPASQNAYFPLAFGYAWEYVSGEELIVREALPETKLIEGVTCIVVRDRSIEDGELREDTDDWYAVTLEGDVHYCGEEVKDYESFSGDDPALPELVSIDGSFKVGRDGDRAGILFFAEPAPGTVYRQEWSPGNAEDAAEVLSDAYAYGADAELDEYVPETFANHFCADGDCVVTAEFTPTEPDAFERKYYARGIGLFLVVNVTTGEIATLTDCNFDSRCGTAPAP